MVTVILTGIAVNAFTGAVIGLLTYFSTDAELRSITFWTLGSLAQATWPKVLAVMPLALVGLAAAMAYARQLDLLALGENDRPATSASTSSGCASSCWPSSPCSTAAAWRSAGSSSSSAW